MNGKFTGRFAIFVVTRDQRDARHATTRGRWPRPSRTCVQDPEAGACRTILRRLEVGAAPGWRLSLRLGCSLPASCAPFQDCRQHENRDLPRAREPQRRAYVEPLGLDHGDDRARRWPRHPAPKPRRRQPAGEAAPVAEPLQRVADARAVDRAARRLRDRRRHVEHRQRVVAAFIVHAIATTMPPSMTTMRGPKRSTNQPSTGTLAGFRWRRKIVNAI